MSRPIAVVVVMLAVMLAGCARDTPAKPAPPEDLLAWGAPGTHPWPTADGSEWPRGLVGPFALLPPRNVQIAGFDGVTLDTWLIHPDVPAGVRTPVVVWASPYFGLNNQAGNDPSGWDNSGASEAVPVERLVSEGYTVAIVSLRGSGNSGGCYALFGSDDWRDMGAVVEALGDAAWSNGRVGVMGLSYHGTTPWMAAGQAPEALKTIITAGQVSNLYTFFHTPQGAALTIGAAFSTLLNVIDEAPPVLGTPQEILESPAPLVERAACPSHVKLWSETYKSDHTDFRDEAWWRDRDMSSTWHNIKASVFVTHGLLDYHGSGHAQEEDIVWQSVPADVPLRALFGQWGHMFPNFAEAYTGTGMPDWDQEVVDWLDYWLKGIGSPRGVGTMTYQDSELRWHNTTFWPPAEAREEVLFLHGGALHAEPAGTSASFRSYATLEGTQAVCELLTDGLAPDGLVYTTPMLEEDVMLAGNPFAVLDLRSDLPGGQVTTFLYDLAPQLQCQAAGLLGAGGVRFLGMGAADLRFHAGNFMGHDFPVDTPTAVRIDINNLAEVVPAGHRLAVVVTFGDAVYAKPYAYAPMVTVHGDSRIVLPVVEGSLGGGSLDAEVPPRPFLPQQLRWPEAR